MWVLVGKWVELIWPYIYHSFHCLITDITSYTRLVDQNAFEHNRIHVLTHVISHIKT